MIIEAKNGIQLQEYAEAVGAIMNPFNIHFMSRISNSRTSIFLAAETTIWTSPSKLLIFVIKLYPLLVIIFLPEVCPPS